MASRAFSFLAGLAALVLGAFLVLNLVLSFVVPSIDPVAHVGGLLIGVVLPFVPEGARGVEAVFLGAFAGICAYGWILG